jgi:hypothetical protein
VCAAFKNENLSIILVNILLVKIVSQKYNNLLNLHLLLNTFMCENVKNRAVYEKKSI